LPPFRPGKPIPTGSLEAIRQSLDRTRPAFGLGNGNEYQQLPGGSAVRPLPPPAAHIAYTTSSIGARSGGTIGYGTGEIRLLNTLTRAASTVLFTNQTLLNLFDQAINVSHYVIVVPIDTAWMIIATDSCSALATGLALGSFDFLSSSSSTAQGVPSDSDRTPVKVEVLDPTPLTYVAGAEV